MDEANHRLDPARRGRFKRLPLGVLLGVGAALTVGLVASSGATATPAATTGPAVRGAECRPAEEPVFRCATKKAAVLTLCVDPTARSVRLLREQGHKRSLIAEGLPAQKVWPGKGYSTILQWNDGPKRWTLFVNGVPAESGGYLTQGPDDAADLREQCKDDVFDVPIGREPASPSGVPLNVYSLPQFGLSRPMARPPKWPQ